MDSIMPSYHLFFITGMSGAGKTLALKILAEMEFHVTDNIPTQMVEQLIEHDKNNHIYKRAIGFGTQISQEKILNFISLLGCIEKNNAIDLKVIYLDASDSVLVGRFATTGLTHPLGINDTLEDNLITERHILMPVVNRADLIIDTSDLHPRKFMAVIKDNLYPDGNQKPNILISSFGFKHSLPKGADLVFDARLLNNPHWHSDIKSYNGKDTQIIDFLEKDLKTQQFLNHIQNYLQFAIFDYPQMGKQFYHIAIGCTGGKHRSVYCGEKLKEFFIQNNYHCHIFHRHLSYDDSVHHSPLSQLLPLQESL